MDNKINSLQETCRNFANTFFDIIDFKDEIDLDITKDIFIGHAKFEKYLKSSNIDEGSLMKDLESKQRKFLNLMESNTKKLNKNVRKKHTNNYMSFINIWNNYEYFQINLIVKYLSLNDDDLRSLISSHFKNKRNEGLNSVQWKAYFNDRLPIDVKCEMVEEFVQTITPGVKSRQLIFKKLEVDLNEINFQSILLLQKIRNTFVHNNGIFNDSDYKEIEKFVNNKDFKKNYDKNMLSYLNKIKKNNKKNKKIQSYKVKTLELQENFDSSTSFVYFLFKNYHKKLKENKLKKEEISLSSAECQYISQIILKDFIFKTFNLLKRSDFDFGEKNEKVHFKSEDLINLINDIVFLFGKKYMKAIDDYKSFDHSKIAGLVKSDFQKDSQLPPTIILGLRYTNFFRIGRLIIRDIGIIDNEGDFSIKCSNLYLKNLLRVNMLGLRYFEDGVVQSYLNVDINKKSIRTGFQQIKMFSLIKHNDKSKKFETSEQDTSLNLNFKFVKHLLLMEFDRAEETLYDCEDLDSETLLSLLDWPLMTDFKHTKAFKNLEDAFGVSVRREDFENVEDISHYPVLEKVEA